MKNRNFDDFDDAPEYFIPMKKGLNPKRHDREELVDVKKKKEKEKREPRRVRQDFDSHEGW